MAKRAEALAERFDTAVDELAKTIDGLSDNQWGAICGDERWTVAATARHVGAQWPLEMEYLTAIADGKPLPTYTWDDINARNEQHAKEFSSCQKADAIKLLREKSGPISKWVRALSDEQLDRTAPLPLADGAVVSTQALIEGGVLIDHAVAHLASIKAAT
jgi:hypothetical protein